MGVRMGPTGFPGYLVRFAIAVVTGVPLYLLGTLVGLLDRNTGTRILRVWNRFYLWLFHITLTVDDRNPPGSLKGCVFVVLNQSSLLDTLLADTVVPLPLSGVINIEYALIPIFGWLFFVFSWVIVRQWPRQAKRTIQKISGYLQSGGNILISIEGKRSKDGTLSPYKKGPVVMAIQAQASIVPLFIQGARDCMPYGAWRVRGGKVTLKFLEAISTEGMRYEDRDTLLDRLRAIALRELDLQNTPLPS
jgi:1-acyl-sn-glycerol-3-phosphate acyltransferase